jgi:transposase/copper chaperone CopZ
MDDSASTNHELHVKNMHCADCAALIDETLRALPGVRSARSTLETGRISVELDPRRPGPEAVIGAITELGFHLTRPAKAQPPERPPEAQVSDAAWRLLEPELRPQGRQVRDVRQLFEGIAYKHRAGVQWREVPAAFGPWQTLYAKWARWCADGTWSRLVAAAGRHEELAWMASAYPAPPRQP